jgi:DNA-binding PadR family transcriptional regulator
MTGYDLASFFDQSTAWVWSAPHSNIYPELKKMQADGLIKGRQETRGKRLQRTVYTITKNGLAELRLWTASPVPTSPERDPLLLKSVFFDLIDPEDAIRLLETTIEDQKALIETWTAHQMALLAKDTPLLRERLAHRDPAEHDRVAALKAHVFQGLISVAQTRIGWAEDEIELLRSPEAAVAVGRRRGVATSTVAVGSKK